jgi:hypothetical protein
MAENSTIEWTDATWNPVTGCTKISAGCDNCYAERFSERFRGVPGHPFKNGFDLTIRPERLLQPLAWQRPRMIFVNSMSDLFHKEIPKAHITAVFDTMERADWHIYQVLTKRSSLLMKFINERYNNRPAPTHMWFGVSVENELLVCQLHRFRTEPLHVHNSDDARWENPANRRVGFESLKSCHLFYPRHAAHRPPGGAMLSPVQLIRSMMRAPSGPPKDAKCEKIICHVYESTISIRGRPT